MKKLILIFLVFLNTYIFGQQQPIYSQYMLNTYLINPSVAGSEGLTVFNLTARNQWVGYEDGPKTYTLSYQSRILKTSFSKRSRLIKSRVKKRRPSGRVGIGGVIYNDVNGKIRRTGLQGTYSYHLHLRNVQLSMGASLSFYQFDINIKPSDLYDQINDPIINQKLNKFSPDANIGLLLSNDKFYIGLSTTSLLQSSIQFSNNNNSYTAYRLLRQYYLIGGYRIEPYRSSFSYEPSFLLTTNEIFNYSIDLNIKFIYKNDYYTSLSYRTTGAVVFMVGFKYDKFLIGYAFDYNFTDVSYLSKNGTHEASISYRIGDKSRKYRWLNRF